MSTENKPKQRPKVLFTRSISKELHNLGWSLGLKLVVVPSIEIEMLQQTAPPTVEVDAWVFTSRNAVNGYANYKKQNEAIARPKRVFSVGKKTQSALKEAGLQSKSSAKAGAKNLAAEILKHKDVRSVLHICGNRRRPELKEHLEAGGVSVHEWIVYTTEERPQKVDDLNSFAAIAFFSPSAAEAFNQENSLSEYSGQLWAIGETTAAAIKEISGQEVEIAPEANAESLLNAIAAGTNADSEPSTSR